MKFKDIVKLFLSGICIGISSSFPGVSGGTIAVILKVYEKLVWAVSHIFKEFKRAIVIILPILIGLVCGMIPTVVLLGEALEGFVFGIICVFAGFIIGSMPQITDEVKGEKANKKEIITLVITFVVTAALGVLSIIAKADTSSHFANPEWWFYLVLIPVGFIASFALVVPGISGGMILILLGFYTPLVQSTSEMFQEVVHGVFNNVGKQVGLLLCFGVGCVTSFFVTSKIMNKLLSNHRRITFFAIIGFILGSLVALFANYNIYSYYQMWMSGKQGFLPMGAEIGIGIALLVVFATLAYLLVRYLRKHKPAENTQQVSEN